MKKAKQSLVHRYTEFEYVIDYLKTGKIGFPSPGEWDDKNDIHFLRLYMEYRQVKNLFCCCFTSVKTSPGFVSAEPKPGEVKGQGMRNANVASEKRAPRGKPPPLRLRPIPDPGT